MDKHETPLDSELNGVLKKVSRTLYLSINILPANMHAVMGVGYLLCRALDTVTDSAGIDSAAKLEILSLSRRLSDPQSCDRLTANISGLSAFTGHAGEKELLCRFDRLLAAYRGLSGQDRALVDFVCSGVAGGMETDIKTFRGPGVAALPDKEDLKKYCGAIGGVPGVFWARLYRDAIKRANPRAVKFPSEQAAMAIGSALQITNILKDMSSDIKSGRCYLPLSELSAKGLSPADLQNPGSMRRIRDIVFEWIIWAVDQLDAGEMFVASIPKTELSMRAAVIWPVYWAMDTLAEIAKANLLDPACRPRIKRRKIYSTMAMSLPLLLSNTSFARGYRFRRETLIVSVNRKQAPYDCQQ